ncbi:SEL1-like repeat protein [Sinimarinibacterium sp. CAU 1509]|uniref:SEL1-like repeat protein n=1 Tax=Sinimarinibacterium sp. CAU 1509 TaxID=2562283 RepID=UPI00146EE4D4|nr:SEL1-like repeat protein [Sinimarinibacterium sp. CAU 1509]
MIEPRNFAPLRCLCAAFLLAFLMPAYAGDGYADGVAAFRQGDYAKAYQIWLPMADSGDARAQFSVGTLMARGQGVEKNELLAVAWFLRSAEQRYALAQYSLGVMRDEGIGIPRDDAEARRWYALAAEQGNASAQANLCQMYASGEGGDKEPAKAMDWCKKSAATGNQVSAATLAELRAAMPTLTVVVPKGNVRSKPSTSSAVVARVVRGDTVVRTGPPIDQWIPVLISDSQIHGFIFEPLVSMSTARMH